MIPKCRVRSEVHNSVFTVREGGESVCEARELPKRVSLGLSGVGREGAMCHATETK